MGMRRVNGKVMMLISTIILLSTILIIVEADSANATEIIVDDSGKEEYTSIQEAIDNASAGDTVRVFEGIYSENIVIGIPISLIGNGSEVTNIIADEAKDVINVSSEGISLSGFSVSGGGRFDAGILIRADNITVTRVNCSDNGIGISIMKGEFTTIRESSIYNNTIGIKIKSDNSTISGNIISGGQSGIRIEGVFNGNSVNSTQISNNSIISGMYGIYSMWASHTDITGNDISNNSYTGIHMMYSQGSMIKGNIISNNVWYGIYLSLSEESYVNKNSIMSNAKGIYVMSNSLLIMGNSIGDHDDGILISGTPSNVSIRHNSIFGSRMYGMYSSISENEIDATDNWWGSDHGPYHPTKNPNGKGETITDGFMFDPWVGKELTVKFVDDDARDGGNGTQEFPYTSIQEAIDEVANEGIVRIMDGTYRESVTINKMVIIYGNGTGSTIIDGEGSNTPVSITADGVNLSGVSCINSGSDPDMGGVVISSDFNHIFNVSSTGNEGFGIRIVNGAKNHIHEGIFSRNGGPGGVLDGGSENTLWDLSFLENGKEGLVLIDSDTNVLTLINCSVNANGVLITSNSDRNDIKRSTFLENEGSGLVIEDSTDILIRDCFVLMNRNGFTLGDGVEGITVEFSSISGNDDHGLDARNGADSVVDAKDNWWGDATGPYHPMRNPDGLGDQVSDHVEFSSWFSVDGEDITYVDFMSTENGDGSKEHPFNDVQEGIDETDEGGIVRILEGTMVFELYQSGFIVSKELHIIGSGINITTFDTHNTLDHQDIFHLEVDGCSVTGFSFKRSSPHHELAAIGLYSDNNHVYENYFFGCNNGMYLSGASGNVIRNNTFYSNYREIRFSGLGDNNNRIENNLFSTLKYYGINMEGSFNIVRDNIFRNGSYLLMTGSNNIASGNDLFYGGRIEMRGDNSTFSNNFIDGREKDPNGTIGVRYAGTTIRGQDHVVSNNTFMMTNQGIGLKEVNRISITGNSFDGNTVGLKLIAEVFDGMIEFNEFMECDQGILIIENGTGNRFNYNRIVGSEWYGFNVTENVNDTFDARFNWWGTVSGPYHPVNNSEGTGDNVTDLVEFSPWFDQNVPLATILNISPNPGLVGQEIEFRGEGESLESITRYVWNSSRDGVIHDESEPDFTTAGLSWGSHEITLQVQTEDGVWSRVALEHILIVNRPIAVLDTSSIPITAILAGDGIQFRGWGIVDGSVEKYTLLSNLDGILLNGMSNETTCSNLSVGHHIISFRVMDDLGFWSEDIISHVNITDQPVALVNPDLSMPASSFLGEDVRFTGIGTGVTEITTYVWESNIDGQLSNGSESVIIRNDLSPGTHTISFRVRNSHDIWSETASVIILVHEKPVAEINSITPDPGYSDEPIQFTGTGIDDGAIVRYVWYSSLSGTIYDGASSEITIEDLPSGTHTISFKVLDDLGVWSENVGRTLTILTPPKASILSISPTLAYEWEVVSFTGQQKESNLRYAWSSSLDGELYNGTDSTFKTSELSRGTHMITHTVMDEDGRWSEIVGSQIRIYGQTNVSIDSVTPNPGLTTDTITFRARNTGNGAIMRYVWTSSLDGELYSGLMDQFEHQGLSSGFHAISLRTMDERGVWREVTFPELEIRDPPKPNEIPTVEITSPVNSSNMTGKVTGIALDPDAAIVDVEVSIDGGEWIKATGTDSWHLAVDIDQIESGNHTIVARSFDGTEYSEPVSITVVVGIEAPSDEKDGGASKDTTIPLLFDVVLIAIGAGLFFSIRKRS
jgi:nitrous oxidase accessory protein